MKKNDEKTWDQELFELGKDFCLDLAKVHNIIQKTATRYPEKSDEWLYDHAYRGIRDLIMAM